MTYLLLGSSEEQRRPRRRVRGRRDGGIRAATVKLRHLDVVHDDPIAAVAAAAHCLTIAVESRSNFIHSIKTSLSLHLVNQTSSMREERVNWNEEVREMTGQTASVHFLGSAVQFSSLWEEEGSVLSCSQHTHRLTPVFAHFTCFLSLLSLLVHEMSVSRKLGHARPNNTNE